MNVDKVVYKVVSVFGDERFSVLADSRQYCREQQLKEGSIIRYPLYTSIYVEKMLFVFDTLEHAEAFFDYTHNGRLAPGYEVWKCTVPNWGAIFYLDLDHQFAMPKGTLLVDVLTLDEKIL